MSEKGTVTNSHTITGALSKSPVSSDYLPRSGLQTESNSAVILTSPSYDGHEHDNLHIQTESRNGYEGAARKQAPPRLTRVRRATTNVFPGIKEIPEPVTMKSEIRVENKSEVTQPVSMVSRLRLQFSAEDDKSSSRGGGGVRRWRSLPPKKPEEKPNVVIVSTCSLLIFPERDVAQR